MRFFLSFFQWWFGQLSAMVPAKLRQFWLIHAYRFRLHVDTESFRLFRRLSWYSTTKWMPLDQEFKNVEDLSQYLRKQRFRRFFSNRLLISVDEKLCLRRNINTFQRSPQEAIGIARIETIRLDPRKLGKALFGVADVRSSDNNVTGLKDHYILNYDRIAALYNQLSDKITSKLQVVIWSTSNSAVAVRSANDGKLWGRAGNSWLTRLAILAPTVCVLVAMSAVAIEAYRQEEQITRLERDIQIFSKRARDVRQQINRISASNQLVLSIVQTRSFGPKLTHIWHDLTVGIPDNAWISAFRFGSDRLEISGTAASASELIGRLEDLPVFSSVRFLAPVIMDQNKKTESFRIEARIRDELSE